MSTISARNPEMKYSPRQAVIPIADTTQIEAAVVKPRTKSLLLTIVPAPRKPMPVITPAAARAVNASASRDGSARAAEPNRIPSGDPARNEGSGQV